MGRDSFKKKISKVIEEEIRKQEDIIDLAQYPEEIRKKIREILRAYSRKVKRHEQHRKRRHEEYLRRKNKGLHKESH